MKKLYLGIVFFLCFFVFSLDTKAKTVEKVQEYLVNMSDGSMTLKHPLEFADVEVFNYFKEKKDNTDFYNFINECGNGIISCLNNYSSYTDLTRNYEFNNLSVFIFTRSEIEFYNNLYIDKAISIPDNADHLIMVYVSPKNSTTTTLKIVSYDNNLNFNFGNGNLYYYFWFNGSSFISTNSSYNTSNYSLLSFLKTYNFSYNWLSSGWWLWKNETYAGSDFSLLYSKLFYSTVPIEFYDNYNLVLNLQYYCYESYCKKPSVIPDLYSLDYFIENSIISDTTGLLGLSNLLHYHENEIIIPNDYKSFDFTQVDTVSMFPIKSCSFDEFVLYLYSNSVNDVDLYLHTLGDNDKFGYQASYVSTYKGWKHGTFKINPLYSVKDVSTSKVYSFDETDFIKYYYRFQARDNKSIYRVYYNPSCYSISEHGETITITNPNTGNDITFNGGTDTWKDPENIGSSNSIPIFGGIDTVSKDGLVSNLKNISSSFIDAASYIVSFSSTLFLNMPGEIQSILLTIFVIGCIVIVIKIIIMII